MIPAIQSISKQHGERAIMWSSVEGEKRKKNNTSHRLSKEILGLFGATSLIAIFCFFALDVIANGLVLNYIDRQGLELTEYQLADVEFWIQGISFVSAVLLFVILFLFLVGERLAYISEIVKGIDALGRHEWDYEIPLQGENELTELAKRVNTLSREEQAFQEKEKQLQEEKASLIRSLSHDIRTPLTSMMSYSEFMKNKESLTVEEMQSYMELVEQKSQQIKVLTDRLLDGGTRQLEVIENGVFFMQQLVEEWEAELESDFDCQIDLSDCPQFSGEFDVQEMRRIFDNLASNIKKYADETAPIVLRIAEKNGRVCVFQSNTCKILNTSVESTKIGIDSIRKIAGNYGGTVEVLLTGQSFAIEITLIEIN